MEGKLSWENRLAAIRLENPARSLTLIVSSLILGFLLTAQMQAVRSRPPANPEYSRDLSAVTIQRLEEEQRGLKETIRSLRAQLASQQQAAMSGASNLASIPEELARQRLAAGLSPQAGPGLIVTLDDSAKNMPTGDDPANYLIHDYELRDVSSLLWLAGAEAISINAERLVSVSSVYCVGSTILVNNTRISPPYEIKAIGNPTTLEDVLRDPAALKKLKSRATLYGVQFRFSQARDLMAPAYTGGIAVKYANAEGQ
jgi:uncharacterized protein YlxW (UPF0749 family)